MKSIQFILFRQEGVLRSDGERYVIPAGKLVIADEQASASAFANSAITSILCYPIDLFPIYQDLKVRLKFYRADEEFAAQVVLLWPANALEYMYYETTFYVLRFLLQKIADKMKEDGK